MIKFEILKTNILLYILIFHYTNIILYYTIILLLNVPHQHIQITITRMLTQNPGYCVGVPLSLRLINCSR